EAQTEETTLSDLSMPEVSEKLQDSMIKEADKEQTMSPNLPIQEANAEQELQRPVSPKKYGWKDIGRIMSVNSRTIFRNAKNISLDQRI
ncbi:unnamed protein product, partial [Cercopithifilaria johnstoni]